MTDLDYVSHLDRESRRFAEVLADTDPLAPVRTCPGWTADDLLWHLTEVQWFWGTIATRRLADSAEAEADKPARPDDHAALLVLFDTATHRLASGLIYGADDTAVWTWAHDRTLGFVRRRQAHEALIHRLDAELISTGATPMDPALSADGIDEILRVMWAELPEWGRFVPAGGGDLLVDAADTGRAWRVTFGRFVGTSPRSGTSYEEPTLAVVDSETAGADALVATVRGRAAALDRWLWGRGDAGVDRSGDVGVLARLDELVAAGVQ